MIGVVRRELGSLVVLPHTWAVASAYLVISGVFFSALFISTRLPDLERYSTNIAATLVVLIPVVAMRSFAEERRTGGLEVVLSWPVARPALVAGRYLVNTAFVGLLVSVMWVYVRLLAGFGDIEVGKALAQYLGLLLVVAGFSALALAVSARSATPTGAVLVGFGMLLGLWTLDVVPGWVGGAAGVRLRDLAPTSHLEPFARGVVPAGDALYFAALVIAGLGAALAATSDRRAGHGWRSTLASGRSVAGVTVAAALVVLALGGGVEAQADLTPAGRYTLSAASRQVIGSLHGTARLVAFVPRGSAREGQIRQLVATYRAAGAAVQLEFVDPELAPSTAKEHGIERFGQVTVDLGGRREVVDDLGEIDLTSALARLSRAAPPVACFTVAHGERPVDGEEPRGYRIFTQRLSQTGYEVRQVALGAAGGPAALQGCSVVVVAGPTVPFLPAEADLLVRFLSANGRLAVFGAESPAVRAQLNSILAPYQVAFTDDPVRDRSALADDPASVVAFDYPSSVPVTRGLKSRRVPLVLSAPVAVRTPPAAVDEGRSSVLVQSSEATGSAGPSPGPVPLAVLGDDSRITGSPSDPAIARTRVGIVGTADVAANGFLDYLGNAEFALRLVQWVGHDEELIAAGHAPGGVEQVVLTAGRKEGLVRSSVVLPGLAPLPGLAWTLLRRRRG